MLVARKASCCVANALSTGLNQPKNHQSVQKPHVLQKVRGVNGLRAEFIASVIHLTVFSADPVISFLKGAWHLSLLRIYSLAFKYIDMSLASFFERNVLDCNKLINFTLIIEHKRNPCQQCYCKINNFGMKVTTGQTLE